METQHRTSNAPPAPPPPPKNHDFTIVSLSQPKSCHCCGSKIWGFSRQASKCSSCSIIVHHRCVKRLIDEVNHKVRDGCAGRSAGAKGGGDAGGTPSEDGAEKEPKDNSSSPSRISNVSAGTGSGSKHLWIPKALNSPYFCDFCKKFVWGLHQITGPQASTCSQCGMIIHHRCETEVTWDCVEDWEGDGEPSSYKMENDAEGTDIISEMTENVQIPFPDNIGLRQRPHEKVLFSNDEMIYIPDECIKLGIAPPEIGNNGSYVGTLVITNFRLFFYVYIQNAESPPSTSEAPIRSRAYAIRQGTMHQGSGVGSMLGAVSGLLTTSIGVTGTENLEDGSGSNETKTSPNPKIRAHVFPATLLPLACILNVQKAGARSRFSKEARLVYITTKDGRPGLRFACPPRTHTRRFILHLLNTRVFVGEGEKLFSFVRGRNEEEEDEEKEKDEDQNDTTSTSHSVISDTDTSATAKSPSPARVRSYKVKMKLRPSHSNSHSHSESEAERKERDEFGLDIITQPLSPNQNVDGWLIGEYQYDIVRVLFRSGVGRTQWRMTKVNESFKLSPSYPKTLFVPQSVSDNTVNESAQFRSKGRLPALIWISNDGVALCRCSQPRTGLQGKRSAGDEYLVASIAKVGPPPRKVVIYDARPLLNASVNALKGAGFENDSHYADASSIVFLGIENIHVMRDSFWSMIALLQSTENRSFLSQLESTGWLLHVHCVLSGAQRVVETMKKDKASVLLHCSDGWDRTPQLTSLVQLQQDPFYCTMLGFSVLIEKEWCCFGHKFHDRLGHGVNPTQEWSPIFLQFLDCVWQIMIQNPTLFEFNHHFLISLADASFSCEFGTFLFNCLREREGVAIKPRCESVWTYLLSKKNRDHFLNTSYRENGVYDMELDPSVRSLRLWLGYYARFSCSYRQSSAFYLL